MTKKKSTLCVVLITIVLVVLCAISFVSFPIPGTVKDFNSLLKNITLGSSLGGQYSVVYYPEGVLSEEDYLIQYEGTAEKDKEEFAARYEKHGALYVETEKLEDGLDEQFATAYDVLKKRFDRLDVSGYSVSVRDDYAIVATIPSSVSNPDTVFDSFAASGEFSLGKSAGQSDLGADRNHAITDYFKSATASIRNHTPFVQINLTKLGKEEVFALTNSIVANSSSSAVVYFNVGSSAVVSLSLSEGLNSDVLYVSGYEDVKTASVVAIVIDSCIRGETFDLKLSGSSVNTIEPLYGENSKYFVLGAYALLVLAMAIYSIVRYRGIAAAHLYAFAVQTFALIIYMAAMPAFALTEGALIGLLLSQTLLVVANFSVFRRAKAESELGKTVTTSVKNAYKQSLFPVLEAHIFLFAAGLLAAFVGVTELQLFGIVFAFGVAMSALCVLVLTRFFWHIFMRNAKSAFKFCNWKSEEID